MGDINNGVAVAGQNLTGDTAKDARDLALLAKSRSQSVTRACKGGWRREFLIPLEDPKGLLNIVADKGRYSDSNSSATIRIPEDRSEETLIELRGPRRESHEGALEDIRPEGGWQIAASEGVRLVEMTHMGGGTRSLDLFVENFVEDLRRNRWGDKLDLQSQISVERVKTFLASLPKKGEAIPKKERKLGSVWAGIAGPVLAGLISEPESPATVFLSRAGRHLKGFFKAHDEKRKAVISLNKREERILGLIFRIGHLGMYEVYREFPEEVMRIISGLLKSYAVTTVKVRLDEDRCALIVEEISTSLPTETSKGNLKAVKSAVTVLKMASEGLQAALGFEVE